MPTNAIAFNAELRAWARDRLPAEVGKLARAVALEALRRVVLRTPVDFGQARGGWVAGLGAPSSSSGTGDPSGGSAIAAGTAIIATAPDFGVIHVSNNVPHSAILDQGGFVPADPGPSKDPRPGRKGRVLVSGGYSVQAPAGMVDVTLGELRAIFGP